MTPLQVYCKCLDHIGNILSYYVGNNTTGILILIKTLVLWVVNWGMLFRVQNSLFDKISAQTFQIPDVSVVL